MPHSPFYFIRLIRNARNEQKAHEQLCKAARRLVDEPCVSTLDQLKSAVNYSEGVINERSY